MGGLVVGNADDYFSRLGRSKPGDLGKKVPVDLFLGGSSEESADDLKDGSIVCSCQKVAKKDIADVLKEKDCATIADVS